MFARMAAMLFLCLQLSGAIHGLVDLLDAAGVAVDCGCAGDDDDDDDDDRCPPGCAGCHCANCGARALPGSSPMVDTVPNETLTQVVNRYDDFPHGNPDLPSVFRPPRTQSARG